MDKNRCFFNVFFHDLGMWRHGFQKSKNREARRGQAARYTQCDNDIQNQGQRDNGRNLRNESPKCFARQAVGLHAAMVAVARMGKFRRLSSAQWDGSPTDAFQSYVEECKENGYRHMAATFASQRDEISGASIKAHDDGSERNVTG